MGLRIQFVKTRTFDSDDPPRSSAASKQTRRNTYSTELGEEIYKLLVQRSKNINTRYPRGRPNLDGSPVDERKLDLPECDGSTLLPG